MDNKRKPARSSSGRATGKTGFKGSRGGSRFSEDKPYRSNRESGKGSDDKPFRSYKKSENGNATGPGSGRFNKNESSGGAQKSFGQSRFSKDDKFKSGTSSYKKFEHRDDKDSTTGNSGDRGPSRFRRDESSGDSPKSFGKGRFSKEHHFTSGGSSYKKFERRGENAAARHGSDDRDSSRFKRHESSSDFKKPFSRSKFSGNDDAKLEKKAFQEFEGADENNASYSKSSRLDKPKVHRSAPAKESDGKVRLNKIIASSGICSRREADDLILAGLVSVNGVIITQLGTKVDPSEDIRYNGERLKHERLVYILLNKPKDYVTTTKDPFAKRTVLELIEGACKERVYPVGRLDRNTTGVLLITNDGDLAKKLTHPSYNRKKVYHVHLDKNLRQADLEIISAGVELEDGFVKADEISYVDPSDKNQVGIEIHSGKNHIVRRIFEHLDYQVTKLDRVYFAGLTKKGLQRGQWRFLTDQEIGMLKMGSYE
jgi:23S rRNA pseudouridine2605 synthase